MKKIFLVLMFSVFSCSAIAAGSGTGKITQIYAVKSGANNEGVIIFATANHTDAPACATTLEWAFDANTHEGKAMYALLLSAALREKGVNVFGTGDCSAWGDRENVQHIHVGY